jgi:hypothetical protein
MGIKHSNKYESLMSTNGEITSHAQACTQVCHISNIYQILLFYTQYKKKLMTAPLININYIQLGSI